MQERQTPEDAIQSAIASMLRNAWTSLDARVVAVDLSISQATVQPLPADYLGGVAVDLPQIPNVPIIWPRGGGAVITFPIAVGDFVLLKFSDRSIARFRDDGSEGDPQSFRAHDLSDAMALPTGLWPDASAISADSSHLVITKPSSGKVLLGAGTGTEAVVRNGDPVNMTAGGAAGWAVWAALVNAAVLTMSTSLGAPITLALPSASPEVVATSTDVEAS